MLGEPRGHLAFNTCFWQRFIPSCLPALTFSTPREFDDSPNPLNWPLRLLLAELKTNIQPLLAGKFAIKLAIRLLSFGVIAELGDRFLHALSYHSRRIFPRKSSRHFKILLLFFPGV